MAHPPDSDQHVVDLGHRRRVQRQQPHRRRDRRLAERQGLQLAIQHLGSHHAGHLRHRRQQLRRRRDRRMAHPPDGGEHIVDLGHRRRVQRQQHSLPTPPTAGRSARPTARRTTPGKPPPRPPTAPQATTPSPPRPTDGAHARRHRARAWVNVSTTEYNASNTTADSTDGWQSTLQGGGTSVWQATTQALYEASNTTSASTDGWRTAVVGGPNTSWTTVSFGPVHRVEHDDRCLRRLAVDEDLSGKRSLRRARELDDRDEDQQADPRRSGCSRRRHLRNVQHGHTELRRRSRGQHVRRDQLGSVQ